MECISSPLCISYPFGELNVELCDVKRSKKRPLWLVWQNRDNLSVHHHQKYNLIFKHGDDLRQDMLILQILRVSGFSDMTLFTCW
ncbi:unnamed protein product [Protopolystoma xenopodis]|uniref:PI3K/PI4K catalytic domain-containing protein n=1 Tax=Protopolystoma xenopodis TaxID=117903 RepID=A0A448X8F4_9PLAT|nr:unnamed protein product [Protopolystoma xenopodis]